MNKFFDIKSQIDKQFMVKIIESTVCHLDNRLHWELYFKLHYKLFITHNNIHGI